MGMVSTMRVIVKEEGFRALYRGIGPTLLGAFPYEGIKFSIFDMLKERCPDNVNPVLWRVSSGALAGIAAGLVMFPNDTVRRLLQMQGQGGQERVYSSAIDCWKKNIREHGFLRLYRGIAPYLIRMVPNAAIQFTIYEELKRLAGE